MLATIATFALIAVIVVFIYYLGYVQGKHVEKSKERRRVRKVEWMLAEAIHRWSPWNTSVSESRAKLAKEYDDVYAIKKNIEINTVDGSADFWAEGKKNG